MTRKEKITRRGTIIILAMTILSVTGSVSALPDLCYGGGGHFGPKTVSPGQLFDIWFSVDNKGDADAGHFSVNFYVSTDTTITASDYYICKYSIGNLSAGSSWIGEWLRSFPGGIPADEYYLGYIIDADNEVEESDETNNTYHYEDKLTVLLLYSVTISSTEGGSVTSPGEGQFEYGHGTDVTLMATADPGYHFTHWSGSVYSTSNPYHLTVDHDYSIKANFAPDEPPGPVQLQACCFDNGSCQDLTPEECIAQGGISQGEGTSCATVTCPVSPALGPVGHWKLDESSGNIAEDSAGDNDGITYGGPIWLPAGGKVDGALEFDGIDDYVDTGYTADLPTWTVSVWVKSPKTPSSAAGSGPVHREKNYQINWNHSDPDYRGAAGVEVGGHWYSASFGTLGANTWYHLAATYNGNALKAYTNGVLITNNQTPSGNPSSETGTLKFGRHSLSSQYFAGTIDDIRIYDYALSADEIYEIVLAECECTNPPLGDVNGDCRFDFTDLAVLFSNWLTCGTADSEQATVPGLVAYWKLDESSGTIAEDSAGENDGTTHGGPVWLPAGGKTNGALRFDGLNDYVDCGNAGALNINDEITIAAWVKTNDAGNSEHNPYVAKGDHSYALKHFQQNSIEFFIYDGGWQAVRFAIDDSFNDVWHHLAGTYDGSNLKLYADGSLQATTPHFGSITSSSFNVNIARNSEETDRFYDGLIDEVRIYDYALSANEIDEIYEIIPAECECTNPPPGDVNGDCRFDFADLDILLSNWLACTIPVGDFSQ